MSGRNGNGRFASGNTCGKGRPRREAEYLEVALDSVTTEDWKRVVCKAVKDAAAGDGRARDWLTRILLPGGGERDEDEMPEAPPLARRHALHNVRLKSHPKRTR